MTVASCFRLPLPVMFAAAASLLAGCAAWRPATVPMRVITDPAHCAGPVDTLLVMLPGSYSLPEDFIREGFVAAVRERHIAADLLLVDAHLGYYRDRSILDRLRADVVGPARGRGYRQIWLAGISIGAYGAIGYARAQPADVDGIVAIGPYLGERGLVDEIAAQGGLERWAPGSHAPDANDIDPLVWDWLQAYATAAAPRPPFYLGYGLDDRYAYGDRLLANALPSARVFTSDGGHDWTPWRSVWRQALDAVPLKTDDTCGSR